MLTMLITNRGNASFWKQTGLNPNVVLPLMFGTGVLLWLTGTLILRGARVETKKDDRWEN